MLSRRLVNSTLAWRNLVVKHKSLDQRMALSKALYTRSISTRSYLLKDAANKKDNDNKDYKASSLISDDLLEKAGMDTGKTEATETEPEIEQEAQTGESSKWEGTAKKKEYKSSTDIKREKRSNMFYAVMLGSLLGGAVYMGRDWEADEEARKRYPNVNSGYAPGDVWARIKARVGDFFQYFNEPIFDKLLPDPLPEPYGRPLTLVLGLDDLLVHSEWTREHGWRTAKRPGVDYFLGYLAQYYEIVIFSSKYQAYSEKIVAKLDPYRSSVSYALFREASRYKDGKIIKDLDHLNRDLSKVIIVDSEADAFSLQPRNAVYMKPWNGNSDDQELVKLIPFLEWVATQPVKDVRPIIESFHDTDIPNEYIRRESLARKKFEEDFKADFERNAAGNWALKFLGIQPKTPPTPMMPQDYIRQEGQKGYQAFQKYLAENGEAMIAEEKKREQEFLNEQKFTLKKLATEGMPTPEEIAAKQLEMQKAAAAVEKSQVEALSGST